MFAAIRDHHHNTDCANEYALRRLGAQLAADFRSPMCRTIR
jgi:hypothetical protein